MTLEEKEKAIIEYYGLRNQIRVLFGEIFELLEAIIEQDIYYKVFAILGETNLLPSKETLKEHTTEEYADVEHVLDQIALKLEIVRDEILKVKEYKADRQLKRIEESK